MLMPVMIKVAKDVVDFQRPGKGEQTEKHDHHHGNREGSTA